MEAIAKLKKILTVKDVASMLGCSKAHVCNATNGRVPGLPPLPHMRMGRRILFRREWVDAWFESGKR